MLDPIFDLLAGLLAWFYSLVPSYGFAIIALTTLVLLVLSPLTYKSTKSMVAMRRLQPEVKRLQKKHKNDREKLNQEMMALYQEHNVSPITGCLPILVQSPVFIVMFRVIRGVTRRRSTIGFDAAQGAVLDGGRVTNPQTVWTDFNEATEAGARNFNPEYLDPSSDMYQSLIGDNEMPWIGIDLARTPLEVIQDSIGSSLPYLAMIVLVAGLGWYQQHQIQGRMTGEVSSQQQIIMKIMPWMLPIFAFTMPGGLVLYFIVSAMLRIAQQAYITRAVYGNDELTTPIEVEHDDDDDDDDDDDGEPENPLAALFGGGATKKSETAPSSRHGSRRPTSGTTKPKDRARPQRSTPQRSSPKPASKDQSGSKAKASDSKSSGSDAGSSRRGRGRARATSDEPTEKVSGWGRAKRSAPTTQTPEKPVSRRVTPKGDSAPNSNRRGKK